MALTLSAAQAQNYFPSYACYQKADLKVAAKNYLLALESTNEGIVTSALAHIGRMKLYFPDRQFPELEKKIGELSMNGQTANIRYRAFLVWNVFNNPSIFTNVSYAQFDDSEALFTTLSNRLDNTLLGSNNPQ